MKLDFSKLLPHIIAVVGFFVITAVYFSPVLKGKDIQSGDIKNWQGVAQETIAHNEKSDAPALWTNSLFGGMPTYLISLELHGNLVQHFHKVFTLWFKSPMGFIFTCMIGFYILLLCLNVNPYVALIGGVAYGFSSYYFIILEAGHNTKLMAISYMAPYLGAVLLAFRGRWLLGGILAAFFLALEISCNHIQITYYLFFIVLILGAFELFKHLKEKQLASFAKVVGVLAIGAVIAVGANINKLWPIYEYGKYSTRSQSELTATNADDQTSGLDKSYALAWSYGVGESFTLLVPNFKGGGSGAIGNLYEDKLKDLNPQDAQVVAQLDSYFGDKPFTSGPVYVGAIVCFLFVLALFIVRNEYRWIFLIATILSLTLAWGKNFMGLSEFFLDYFPGYNKFRTVEMILVIAELAMPVLAFLALDQIIKNKKDIKMKQVYIAFGLTGGLALLFWLMPDLFNSFMKDDEHATLTRQLTNSGFPQNIIGGILSSLEETRMAIFRADALRTFGFILAGLIALILYLRNTIKTEMLIGALGLLILVDMWAVNKRYLNEDNFVKKAKNEAPFPITQADQQILNDPDPNYRVFNTTRRLDQDASTSYYHKSLGGYHGAKMKRYQELIDAHLSQGNQAVFDMMNTKYYIINNNNQLLAQRNPNACGNVWLVNDLKWVKNADEELAALKEFDPRELAVIDERFKNIVGEIKPSKSAGDTAYETLYEPGKWEYQIKSSGESFAVFSEIYYPVGMKVFIDGQPAEHVRVNYVLRGMKIPAGNHKVEFVFEPQSYHLGEIISYICSGLLILLLGVILYREIKGEKVSVTDKAE